MSDESGNVLHELDINDLLNRFGTRGTYCWYADDRGIGLLETLGLLRLQFPNSLTRYPELNAFTALASPGRFKRISVEDNWFVSKKSIVSEIDKAKNEIIVAREISRRFEAVGSKVLGPSSADHFEVHIVAAEAVVLCNSNEIYQFMEFFPFPTLDEVIINRTGNKAPAAYLADIRRLFDRFAELGIRWRDLAPRNILVDERQIRPRYIILDFEKSQISAWSDRAKADFWRGSVVSEELASTFELNDILCAFGDLFDPTSWEYSNEETIDSSKMRREVRDLFDSSTIERTIGAYNVVDISVINIRQPFVDPVGFKHFPGKICFLIDHMLGVEYDQKFTEVLLFSDADGRLAAIRRVEDVLHDFGVGIAQFVRTETPALDVPSSILKAMIDDLHSSLGSRRYLSESLPVFRRQISERFGLTIT